MVQKMKVLGVPETRRLLRQLPDKLSEQAKTKALRAGGTVIAREARRRVPKNTGNLRRAITVRRRARKIRARFGGRVAVTLRWPMGAHGHLVEFGTVPRFQASTGRFTGVMPARPFFRPALDTKGREAARAVSERLAVEIEKAAQKASAGYSVSGYRPKTRKRKRYRFSNRVRSRKSLR